MILFFTPQKISAREGGSLSFRTQKTFVRLQILPCIPELFANSQNNVLTGQLVNIYVGCTVSQEMSIYQTVKTVQNPLEIHSLQFKGCTFPYKWLVVNNVNVPP